MQIFGGVPTPQDLTYVEPEGDIGPSFGIFLSEPPSNSGTWILKIAALTDEGRFEIGRIVTTAANALSLAGYSPVRMCAAGMCPGAKGLFVTAQSSTNQRAEIFIKSAAYGSASVGVTKIDPNLGP